MSSAKPLRVKVPKSKERALIREFGLDVAALTEDEASRRRSELTALVKMGKARGFLTQQEVNDHLPERLTHPWFYDAQSRAQQRLRDEAAYPEGSPWRYDDVTSDNG